jgi:flagellar biogenesis protein FliO
MTPVLEITAVFLVLMVLWIVRQKRHELFHWASISRRPKQSLQVVDHVRLTPNHSIHVVRLANRMIVVAVHPAGCQLLGRGAWPSDAGERLQVREKGV